MRRRGRYCDCARHTHTIFLVCCSVTSVKTRDELYGSGAGRRSVSGPSPESPRPPKLTSQPSIVGSGSTRVSRQRSFKNASEDVIKRARAQQAASYQLSQDLHDKQVSEGCDGGGDVYVGGEGNKQEAL